MKKIFKISLLAYFAVLTGCASIAGSNTREVTVKSNPSGATIMLENRKVGVTPAVVKLPSYIYGGKTLTLHKKGYEEQSVNINSKFQPISLVNILFWPGFIVDIATGDIVKIDPADLNVTQTLNPA